MNPTLVLDSRPKRPVCIHARAVAEGLPNFDEMTKKWSEVLRGYIIRFMFAALCLALLYYFGLLQFDSLLALYHRPTHIIVGALLLFATIPLSAFRWHLLLWCQGFRLPFRKTLQVVFVGLFFSTFLPGSHGGDIVRAGYIYHGARQQTGILLMSILVDRLTGLAGLIGLGLAVQFALPSVIDFRIAVFMVVLIVVVVFGSFFLPRLGRLIAMIFQRFGRHIGMGERILQLSEQIGIAIRVYMKRADILIAAVFISVVQFALSLAAVVVIANAFDFVTVAPVTIIYAGIASMIANAIPITPGGIGVGEAAFANAITLMDPQAIGPYATVFLAVRALTLLLSLPGGGVFLVYRSEIIEYTAEAKSHSTKS